MLTPERSLEDVSDLSRSGLGYSKNILCFELGGQDKISIFQQVLVGWHHFFANVDLAFIAHNRIEHCLVQLGYLVDTCVLTYPKRKHQALLWLQT